MARNPRPWRARSSASKPVASAQAPWTNTIVGVAAAVVTAPLLTICPMPRLYPGGRAQPRQANLRWCGCYRLPFAAGQSGVTLVQAPTPMLFPELGRPWPAPGEQLGEVRVEHAELVAPGVAHDPEVKAALLLMVIAARPERLQALDLGLNIVGL